MKNRVDQSPQMTHALRTYSKNQIKANLTEQKYEQVKRVAQSKGWSIALLIRTAIDDYIRKNQSLFPKS